MRRTTRTERVREIKDEPPPFLGTWGRLYAAVAAYLGALIVLFYIFTRVFSR